jgi:sugar lactone lactonase YvrE
MFPSNFLPKPLLRAAAAGALCLTLGACGDDNDNGYGGGYYAPSYAVQYNGSLSGLAGGTSIALDDTAGDVDTLTANGAFTLASTVPAYSAALVGVLAQPAGQNCTVANGTPDALGNVSVGIACAALPAGTPPQLTLYAGSVAAGHVDGSGAAASFNVPNALAADAAGNLYVAEYNTVRKIAPGGVVTTLAGAAGVIGSSDGAGAGASFNQPGGIAVDSAGNVYVADTGNNTVRQITPAGVVTTLAGTAGVYGTVDGTGGGAAFAAPVGIAVAEPSGIVYVTEVGGNTVRAIAPGGVVTTLAGAGGAAGSSDGTGAAARFFQPQGLKIDAAGNLIVADSGNSTIRQVTPAGVVTTLAGIAGVTGSADGALNAATFSAPLDVAIDGAGDIYVADNNNELVRKISAGGAVSTVAGTAGQDVFNAGLLPGGLQNPTSLALVGTTLYLTTLNAVAQISNVP